MDMGNGSMHHHGMMMYFHTEIGGDYVLFESWKPQTNKDMVLACFATVLFTIFYEAFKVLRTKILVKILENDSGNKYTNIYHMIQSLLNGVQYLISYCLMLIAMTYQIYLILAIVIGAIIGNFIFFPLSIESNTGSADFIGDPCCG
ncbi:Copper transporter-like protein [Euroglyphus maynei]|uniref:Copper transport protein n=1 Tax=Euroglyphus maynei TaxID=6958 RepID=A0A1Y3AZY0_EURMA|nr:Copper transporter-like protein [Euroglyphus maynei]